MEGDVEHHVGGLAADAGQGFERGAIVRHLAAVAFQQQARQGDDVFRLGAVEAYGLDIVLDAGIAQCGNRLWRRVVLEQRARGAIHSLVGGLGGEHYRDQQLVGRGVFELAFGFRIGGREPREELANLFGRHAVAGVAAGG